jgi:hypothetical protein
MTEHSDRPDQPERPVRPERPAGAHAPELERGPIGQLVRLLLTQLLAVVAIATVITVVVAWTGAGLDDDVTATPATSSGSATPKSDASPTATSTPPSSSAPATPEASSPTPSSSSTPAQSEPLVDVLNQSAGDGAASQAADQLRAAGWRIGRVDDFRGNVSETTVYYPPGLRAEARRLRGDLPGSPRVQPAFRTLKAGRLSVILVG